MKIIQREDYLKKMRALRDQNLIKILTGVRRCGKSTLLRMYRDELLTEKNMEKRVQYIDFEKPSNSYGATWKEIYDQISASLVKNKMNYIFLDEVQYIDNFEKLLVGLQNDEFVDLYVTGSNAHMLSSELATLLSGRSFEIKVLPLSFNEYLELVDDSSRRVDEHFQDYLSFGGFPQAAIMPSSDPVFIDTYLSGIYETIVGRDIMDRGLVNDKSALNSVVRFLLDNIGSSVSVNSIADALNLPREKIDKIMEALTASFLFYPVSRYDIKGKELLKSQKKYYAVDTGLKWALLGRDASIDSGRILENIVYLELLRRGNKITIGKVGNQEMDFVARDSNGLTSYYQVSWTVGAAETLEREIAPFKKAADFNARYLLTMDYGNFSHNGIRQLNIIEWLTGNF